MSRKFLTPVSLTAGSSLPASGVAGDLFFKTDESKIYVHDGSNWIVVQSDAFSAAEVTYDNSNAELQAANVKAALDELSLGKADVGQLSTNLAVFATTAASDITGYNALVSTVEDSDFDGTAVDVPTGAVNADGQLIASLASDAGLFEGQVDPITVTTIGNIRKTAGNQNKSASFYFEVYIRNAAGTETLVGTSDDTGEVNPPNLNEYQEFSASAFVSFGTVEATDRIVLKFYGNVADGAGAEYDFQFGGDSPVRTLIPVPANVVVVHEASGVTLDTTNFDNNLSGADNTVQAALETLDDLTSSDIALDTTNFDNNLSSSDTTVQAALETLDELTSAGSVLGLSDTELTSLANGDVLVYNSDTSKWVNAQPSNYGNIDGGNSLSIYSGYDNIDGGTSTAVYDGMSELAIDGGSSQ